MTQSEIYRWAADNSLEVTPMGDSETDHHNFEPLLRDSFGSPKRTSWLHCQSLRKPSGGAIPSSAGQNCDGMSPDLPSG